MYDDQPAWNGGELRPGCNSAGLSVRGGSRLNTPKVMAKRFSVGLRSAVLALCVLYSGSVLANAVELFPRPAELEPDVAFWVQVYASVDSNGGLLHDRRYLNVIYDEVHFPAAATASQHRAIVNRARERYQSILRALASGPHDNLGGEAQRILSLFPGDVSRDELRAAASRIRFQRGQADRFRDGVVRSGAYMEHIHQTLDEMGLPRELAALAHVESSFTPYAWSHVGAAGMWQFTRATGQRFMRVDDVIDERMDPYTSTVAAARLLEHNLDMLDTWPLALTAYNHGSTGMRRASRELGTTDIEVILRQYRGPRFGFASRNFYPAFLAAVEVHRRADEIFGLVQRESPREYTTAMTPAFLEASELADRLYVDVSTLRANNPALRPKVWDGTLRIPRGFELRLPREELGMDLEEAMAMLDPGMLHARQRGIVTHVVQRGETLSGIAARHGLNTRALASFNNLGNGQVIHAGQNLKVPVGGQQTAGRDLPDDGIYRVQAGDTLSSIARRHGVNQGDLVAYNEFSSLDRIYPGQELHLTPAAAATSRQQTRVASAARAQPVASRTETTNSTRVAQTVSSGPADYSVSADGAIVVLNGETLGHYADWLGIRAARLRHINNMSMGQPVVVGQRLRLEFTGADPEAFEHRRRDWHNDRQGAFFERYQIIDSRDYTVQSGDSLWTLARDHGGVPLWLLRQYNPEADLGNLRAGTQLKIPVIERRSASVAPAAAES